MAKDWDEKKASNRYVTWPYVTLYPACSGIWGTGCLL